MDSSLQKLAQDRPTSDVLLKVKRKIISKDLTLSQWSGQVEACGYFFERTHLSDHAGGNLKHK